MIGTWRGEEGKVAQMTLVWGTALVAGGAVATAELAALAVDQALLTEDRFTMIAPDDYRGDLLDIRLWGRSGSELAHESLYEDDDGRQLMRRGVDGPRRGHPHPAHAQGLRDRPVDRATLDELLDLARWAPNHHLTNPWRFRVVGPAGARAR